MSIEYLKKQLGANEEIRYSQRHHWIFPIAVMIKWFIFAAVVIALIVLFDVVWSPDVRFVKWFYLILLIPVVRIAWGFLSWRMNVYVLTNRRVVEVTGVLNKKVSDSSLEKLTDVVLKQPMLGRLLNYGDIDVLTAAAGAGINYLKQIRSPMEFKTAMVNAKEALEREMGQSR
jgi:uncharacterized membrane protein YdbT with pleckstrin-like domain